MKILLLPLLFLCCAVYPLPGQVVRHREKMLLFADTTEPVRTKVVQDSVKHQVKPKRTKTKTQERDRGPMIIIIAGK